MRVGRSTAHKSPVVYAIEVGELNDYSVFIQINFANKADVSMATQWVVSEFTLVSWRSGQLEITSAASGTVFSTDDVSLLRLLHAFTQPKTIEDVNQEFAMLTLEQLTTRVDNLIRAGLLIPAFECEAAEVQHWDLFALAYHRRSRRVGFQKAPGKDISAKIRPVEHWIPLNQHSVDQGRDFVSVLHARRSHRHWSTDPISFDTFSQFLWLSARNRRVAIEEVSGNDVSRPYPSGGGIYSLELYLVIAEHAVETVASGLYRYLPADHGLEPVSMKTVEFLPFLEAAGRSAGTTPPPIVLLVTSRFANQSDVYGDLSYSLILKEVGCLFQTMYLVGEYLNLGPCALGGGAPIGRLARLCKTSEVVEPLVGEFMLGQR